MIVASSGFPGDVDFLFQLDFFNDTFISDCIKDIILDLFESEIFALLGYNTGITAENDGILRCSHIEGTSILGDVDFVRLAAKDNREAPRADQLSLNHGCDGRLDVHTLV